VERKKSAEMEIRSAFVKEGKKIGKVQNENNNKAPTHIGAF
jgi:hypothetical protein